LPSASIFSVRASADGQFAFTPSVGEFTMISLSSERF
jgi:hypothetical protein